MPERPNILWLMTDEQRADSLGHTGAAWTRTPSLDRLAAAGTCFGAAYTPSPVCIPARGCMLTGRAGSSIGVLNNHHALTLDNPRFLTWEFATAGYQVASFGKHHYACARRAFDVEEQLVLDERVGYLKYNVPVDPQEAGVEYYRGGKTPWVIAGRFPGGVEQTAEMRNVHNALEWMAARDPGRPYFLRISLNAPHTPIVAPAPFDTMIDPDGIDLPMDFPDDMTPASDTQREYHIDYAGTHRLAPEQIRRMRQCYYGRVAFLDHVFGVLIDELARRGELENTIVVFCSDHGTHLGDHGFIQKQSFFEGSVTVPFFFTWPGRVSAGRVHDAPVNTGSLLPTLQELAGLPVAARADFPSIAGALTGGDCPGAPVFSEIDFGLHQYRDGDRRIMVRDGRWKAIVYRDAATPERFAATEDPVLFDLETDPGERENRAADPACAATLNFLRAGIDRRDAARDERGRADAGY